MRGGSSSEMTGKHVVDSTLRRQITYHPLNVTDGFINVPMANSLNLVLLSSPPALRQTHPLPPNLIQTPCMYTPIMHRTSSHISYVLAHETPLTCSMHNRRVVPHHQIPFLL